MKYFLILILLSGCKPIQYKPDLAFISDGLANMPSAIVEINKTVCKGGCYITAKKNEVVTLKLLPIDFNYEIRIFTSPNWGVEKAYSVIGKEGLEIQLPATSENVVNLLGRIYPENSEGETDTIFFEARIRFYEAAYIERVTPFIQKGFLIFGEEAKYVNCEDKLYNEKPAVKSCAKGFSVSESMRVNSYGY